MSGNKKLLNIIAAALVCLLMNGCSSSIETDVQTSDDTKIEESTEHAASAELKAIFEAYFADMNAKNYDNIPSYFVSDYDSADMVENLKTFSSSFTSNYEIMDYVISDVEGGIVSCTVKVKHTSTNLETDSTVILKEPYTFFMIEENGSYKISSMALGATEIIDK